MIKVSKKTLVIVLALIAVIATAGTAFAYWASGVSGTGDQTKKANVDIGAAEAVTTTVTLADIAKSGKKLVPVYYDADESETNAVITGAATGAAAITAVGALTNETKYIRDADDVIYVEYEANATWTLEDLTTGIDAAAGTLVVEYTSAKVVGNDTYDPTDLFIVVIDYTEAIATGTPNLVKFTIFMNEPADDDEYLLIAEAEVEFTFTYSVSNASAAA